MNHANQDEVNQEDIFILDRDQPNQRDSTPLPIYHPINPTHDHYDTYAAKVDFIIKCKVYFP